MECCRLCRQPKKLIQAHVIPEAFFREMRVGDGAPPLLVKTGEYPRRSPIGVYDQTILCAIVRRVSATSTRSAHECCCKTFGRCLLPFLLQPADSLGMSQLQSTLA
jgi:hypothetical protein